MNELTLNSNYKKPLVIGLGFFDCVHAGHRALIKEVMDYAKKHRVEPCVTTFSNNPYHMFNPDSKVVNTYLERISILESIGIKNILPFVFDAEFKKIAPTVFLDMLFNVFNIKGIVCGYDYLFGFKGAGDAEYLKQYCCARGVYIKIIEPVLLDGERVSSTIIKEFLQNGEIEKAGRFLSAPFFMRGTVSEGIGRGRTFGFPTANLSFKKSKLVPQDGVYQTKTELNGKKIYRSVTNVGAKPTFSDSSRGVETFIDGVEENLYGKEIKIEFLKRLRGIEKFDSAQQLAEQIKKDLRRP